MAAGVQLSLEPAEEAIIAKTDELIESQVSDLKITTCATFQQNTPYKFCVELRTIVECPVNKMELKTRINTNY